MAAFNYRDLVRQVRNQYWEFYFQARKIELPEGAAWNQPEKDVQANIQEGFDALDEDRLTSIYAELRRVKSLASARGVQALRNTVPLGHAMLDDFEHHISDAERALWALINWPTQLAEAESIMQADAEIGKRTWRRIQLPPGQELHHEAADIAPLRQALAEAFTPKKGRPRACEIDVLTRHLDGGVQLDIRVEDNLQRSLEFGADDKTMWRDVRPPLRMTAIIYPESGVIDLLVVGGEKARQKLIGPLGTHVFKKPLEPMAVNQPLFLLNRLREGVVPDEHSGLDLHDHGVMNVRLSECRLRSVQRPMCDYVVKPPADKDDLQTALAATLRYCPVLGTESEVRLAAIVDFTFNLGPGRLQTSTLRRRVNQRDWTAAASELRRWVYGGGKVLTGLVARREAERVLLL